MPKSGSQIRARPKNVANGVDTFKKGHVRTHLIITDAALVKPHFRSFLAILLLSLVIPGRIGAQPASVLARIEVRPLETLKIADFDPISPSSAPIVFTTYVTTTDRAIRLRLEVDVESGRFGFLGTTSLDLGLVPGGTTLMRTNRDFDTYDLDDASDELIDVATEQGFLPPDNYIFTLRAVDVEEGVPVGVDTGTITTTNSGRQIDLVGPGTRLDQEPDVVSTPYPVFQWLSDASEFDFALYEVRPGQGSAEDIVAGLPVFRQENLPPGTFVYPNAAEDLVDGKVYAWQIQAVSLTSGGSERFPSEVFWFTVEGIESPVDEDGLEPRVYSRVEIEPQEAEVPLGGTVILKSTVFDAENQPVFDVAPEWSVVPASLGTVDANGVFVAGNSSGVAAVVATLGDLEQFATVEIGEATESPKDDVLAQEPSLQILAPADGQVVMEATPTFAWIFTSGDSTAAAFRVALRESHDEGANYETAALLWEAEVPSTLSSLTYPRVEEPLESGMTYFVRVTAVDSTGEALLRSPASSFSTLFSDKLSYELQRTWEEAIQDGTDTTAVRILLRAEGIASTSLLDEIEAAGATIELVEGPWVQVSIPFANLNGLVSLGLIDLASLPSPHEYLEGPYLAFGDIAGKTPVRRFDYGDPAKFAATEVAVFEFGFDPAIIEEMLPEVNIRYHSFRADKRIDGSGGADTRHGAAVVRALAEFLPPNSTIHLVNFDTEPEFHHALDYTVHELNVDVITCSVSWANAYDHYDGTSYFSRRVERILASQTPLVVAAGNFAQSHWQANFRDEDEDDTHDFDPATELLELQLDNKHYYNFLMSWNDWGGEPKVDLDIEIYNAAGELLLDRRGRAYASRSVQGPTEYAEPVERIRAFKPIYPGVRSYYVKVFRKRDTPSPVERGTNFELYVSPPPDHGLPGPVLESSLAAGLATTNSPAVIPIGANDLSHSSQGPTNDGRVRPDFSADGVVQLDDYVIRGTSFAAPRVAAIFALVFSTHPDWTIKEAYDFLRRFAVQPDGTAGKNDRFGWGQLDVDAVIEALTS